MPGTHGQRFSWAQPDAGGQQSLGMAYLHISSHQHCLVRPGCRWQARAWWQQLQLGRDCRLHNRSGLLLIQAAPAGKNPLAPGRPAPALREPDVISLTGSSPR